jgi:hypothetical protein
MMKKQEREKIRKQIYYCGNDRETNKKTAVAMQ